MVQTKNLSKQSQQELFTEFCQAFLSLKTTDEAIKFLTDLLTKKEMTTLAKRLRIAKLLIEEKSYREIERLLKTSPVTVAKVAEWLTEAGEGFRVVAERTKKKKPKPLSSWTYVREDWRRTIRKFPLYFLPEILIEDIVAAASKRKKERLRNSLERLDKKSELYKKLNKILNK